MTVRNIRKPSLLYGLGVRSSFSSYDLESRDAPILSWLEERGLRSNLAFEEAVLSRVDLEDVEVASGEVRTITKGERWTVSSPLSIRAKLVGSEVEDMLVSVLVLDVRADTKLVLEAEPDQRCVHLVYASVADGASLSFNDLVISGHDAFRRTSVVLHESAKVFPNHAFFTFGDAKVDVKSDVTHIGRESFSDMKVRGVLAGSSQVIVQGDVTITPSAFDANGYQQEDLILASPTAIARPIPNLEIGNNEVKCSHGATVSSVDPEAIFYARSRGISYDDARSLLLASFIAPVLTLFDESELDRIRERIGGLLDEAR